VSKCRVAYSIQDQRLLKKIIFTLLLLPALVYLTKVGIADFLRLAPCAYVEAVQKGEVRLDPAELVRSRERLLSARAWDSSNPIVPEFLGQIALMRSRLVAFSPKLQLIFLHEAADEFQRAIILRPSSAYLWAARMTAGSWLIETNAIMAGDEALARRELTVIGAAMRRADTLGPWESTVLQQIVRVGTLRYTEFSPDVRVIVDGAVARAKQLNLKMDR